MIPKTWQEHGGVMLPMYQSEALWINFNSLYISERNTFYPFIVKIATGKIDAVSGSAWVNGLFRNPQNYIVVPHQPWLDGYCVDKGIIRQFVAMPLGKGYTAEEQLTKKSEYGGIQIQVYPMKLDIFEKKYPIQKPEKHMRATLLNYSIVSESVDMGLAPGGKMKQEIYDDPYKLADWDQNVTSRCFVHIANSEVWKQITQEYPPMIPPTSKDYSTAGLPWFDYYADDPAIKPLQGSNKLSSLKTVKELGLIKEECSLPENNNVDDMKVITLGGKSNNNVREGNF